MKSDEEKRKSLFALKHAENSLCANRKSMIFMQFAWLIWRIKSGNRKFRLTVVNLLFYLYIFFSALVVYFLVTSAYRHKHRLDDPESNNHVVAFCPLKFGNIFQSFLIGSFDFIHILWSRINSVLDLKTRKISFNKDQLKVEYSRKLSPQIISK